MAEVFFVLGVLSFIALLYNVMVNPCSLLGHKWVKYPGFSHGMSWDKKTGQIYGTSAQVYVCSRRCCEASKRGPYKREG